MNSKLPDNSSNQPGSDTQDPEIKVLTKDEMAGENLPPSDNGSRDHKKGGLLSRKKIVLAVIAILLIADIPIGYQLYKSYTTPNKLADTSQDTRTKAQEQPTLQPSPNPTNTPPPPTSTPQPLNSNSIQSQEPAQDQELAEELIQTHSECFENSCIEVEGPGQDQCFVNADCETEATKSSELADFPIGGPQEPTTIPITQDPDLIVPETPAAGSFTQTAAGILSGLGIILLALLL